MAKYDLTVGVRQQPVKAVFYGPEGIGKSTTGAQMPDPVFIDIEGGTNQLPVARLPRPTSWEMLLDEIRSVRDGDVSGCATLVIDTVDAAELLCQEHTARNNEWDNIDSPGYNKGFVASATEFGRMLDLLSEVVEHGRNVVLLGHSIVGKVTRPDESEYTIFTMNLTDRRSASTNSMVKAWCDMLLFFDWKVYVETDKSGKGHASGGKRVIHTSHRVSWDAKNRFGLPDEMPMNSDSIQKIHDLMSSSQAGASQPAAEPTKTANPVRPSKGIQQIDEHIAHMDEDLRQLAPATDKPVQGSAQDDPRDSYPERMHALADLMRADSISDEDLRRAMAAKGYVTLSTPVASYQQRLVDGVVASWSNFVKFVCEQREAIA